MNYWERLFIFDILHKVETGVGTIASAIGEMEQFTNIESDTMKQQIAIIMNSASIIKNELSQQAEILNNELEEKEENESMGEAN